MLAIRSAGLHVEAFLLEAVVATGDVGADVVHFVRPPAPVEKLRSPVDSSICRLELKRRLVCGSS